MPQAGIDIEPDLNTWVRGVVIRRVISQGNHGGGALVWGRTGLVEDVTLENSSLLENTGIASFFVAVEGSVKITGNQISKAGKDGIYLAGTSGALIENNRVESVSLEHEEWFVALFVEDGSRNVVKNNVVRAGGGSPMGIVVRPAAAKDNSFLNNDICVSKEWAQYIDEGTATVSLNNELCL